MALLALAISPHGASAQNAAPFRIIVNASNPVATITKEQAAKLFFKKQRAWPSGEAAVPVDLTEQSPARQAFSTQVLGKDAAAMKGYWQQMIFTGKGVPPLEKATEAEAIAFVAATPGAVGYVAPGTPLPAGVKTVSVQN
ncbi:MAG TPA: hypothetical protein VFJ74_05470 [Gemmatimonadaceae bacterium]|nr:hypothetical protein [Gemmatimonadaceae bacterium]